MRYVVTADEMRSIDAATIDEIGLPGVVLMENAGRGVAEVVLEELDEDRQGRVAVVCGAGNNGGDGYVIARVLREEGVRATVYLAGKADRVRGDARTHLQVFEQLGGRAVPIDDAASLAESREEIEDAAIVVDAVFGTGLAREVEGHYREVLETINKTSGRIVSVDIPSGLSADRGTPLGIAVEADRTVTMAFLKVGLAVSPGFAACGPVTVVPIGIPRALATATGIRLALLEQRDVREWLPMPGLLDHKNVRGHVLVVAGSPGKRGAARLAALGAMRAGAGMVTIAAPGGGGDLQVPDPIMSAELDPDRPDALSTLEELSRGKKAIAIGPGMPTTSGGRELVRGALERLDVPLVLDADALNHLRGDLERIGKARARVVITPHPGEAGRLLGTDAAEVERDRVAAVRRLAAGSRAVAVLKGARALVCDGSMADELVTINPTGGPMLATAGSGDVLTGVIAALVAQGAGAGPGQAARLGVWLHGLAGELAAADLSPWSLTASDVHEAIPDALEELAGARP